MRQHTHMKSTNFERSVVFYSALYGPPALITKDYAKWEPDTLAVIFALTPGQEDRIDHMGFKGTREEIAALIDSLRAAGFVGLEQNDAACCHIVADKVWLKDPSGMAWELYSGKGTLEFFGDDARPDLSSNCCDTQSPNPICCPAATKLPASLANLQLDD